MIYTIKKGRHNSNILNINRLWLGFGAYRLDFSFQFLNNPTYRFGNEDDMDINKLFGLSFGLDHHKNSFRLGWRPVNDDQVSLHLYWYNKGKRCDEFMYIINYNTLVNGGMIIDRDRSLITTFLHVKGNVISEETYFNFKGVSPWSLRLFPYFGGNKTAPHDIYMSLKNDIKCQFKI